MRIALVQVIRVSSAREEYDEAVKESDLDALSLGSSEKVSSINDEFDKRKLGKASSLYLTQYNPTKLEIIIS